MIDTNIQSDSIPTLFETFTLDPISSGETPPLRSVVSPKFINVDQRTSQTSVFNIDDKTFRSTIPRSSHWSIAWSDLMMTMFVLFLSMFTYQMAHQEFLKPGSPEIIGGDTTDALQVLNTSPATLPFDPIVKGLPLIIGGTIKMVVPTPSHLENGLSVKNQDEIALNETKKREFLPPVPTLTKKITQQKSNQLENILEPQPLPPIEELESKEKFQEIYRMSQGALTKNNLSKFAAIDLVPDKTMRIILTGDLLFGTGDSELSESAKKSLQKITGFIKNTPYTVNIVGHTDNVPMRSNKYASNWELSVGRATTVARFLIDDIGMEPSQFIVSGYSSFRPIAPNTNAENRSRNRRVEIIVSKKLSTPLPLTAQNMGS